MATHCSVPPSGLDVFPLGAFLQVEFSLGIEHMEVHNGMQQHAAAVAFLTGGVADNPAFGVYDGEELLPIVLKGCYHGINNELSP